jgi:penicillin-binding protein 1C
MRLASDARFVRVDVCPLSGALATKACGHVVHEWLSQGNANELRTCAMHEHVAVDARNGLRAGRGCSSAFVVERTFERFDAPFAAWAAGARRDVAPDAFSPWCPATRDDVAKGDALRIGYPRDGARFLLDPDRTRAQQALAIRVDAPRGVERVDVRVDGRVVARVGAPFVASWAIVPGEHVLTAEAGGMEPSEPVRLRVD